MRALRSYWVGFLARSCASQSIDDALHQVVRAHQHQQQAMQFLQRLRLNHAVRAFVQWRSYVDKCIQARLLLQRYDNDGCVCQVYVD